MSVVTHRTLTCDRCGEKMEAVDPHQEYAWGMLEAGRVDGLAKIGPADLCPACIYSLELWFGLARR